MNPDHKNREALKSNWPLIVDNHRKFSLLLFDKLDDYIHIKWVSEAARLYNVFISWPFVVHVVHSVGALRGNCTLNALIHCFCWCWLLIKWIMIHYLWVVKISAQPGSVSHFCFTLDIEQVGSLDLDLEGFLILWLSHGKWMLDLVFALLMVITQLGTLVYIVRGNVDYTKN